MHRAGDVAFRAVRTSAGILLCVLSVACEREPSAPNGTATLARPPVLRIARARVIEPGDLGIANPPGVEAWSRADVADPINTAFDAEGNRLLILESSTNQLVEMSLDRLTMNRIDARRFGLRDPQGLTVDPASGRLFVLDAGPRIVGIDPHPLLGFRGALISVVDLAPAGLSHVRGIAFDPTSGHLHVLDPVAHELHEVSQMGRVVAIRDVSEFRLHDPQGMTFGPSGDATDDASAMGLYVAAGGRVTELSLALVIKASATTVTGGLIRTTLTSQYSPPSPDPSGIAYATHLGKLVIADGEVDEMSIYAGANMFETTLSGSLSRSWTAVSYSDEPVGAAYNPANRHLFISDDVSRQVYEVDPGADGLYRTADDQVTAFDTDRFGSNDPEGIAYDAAHNILYIADGVNAQVYRITAGSNGVFDGVSPSGDDQVTSFDTEGLGLVDPEGIAFDSDFGHLYVVGKPDNLVFHISTTGTVLRTIDISAANSRKPAGLEYAPPSGGSGPKTLYIVARGVDNDSDPKENDGKMYEFSVPSLSGNTPPTVTITAPANGSTSTQGDAITFTGTASDAQDGDLTAALAWTSSLDGALGSGGSVTTSSLSLGDHTITASVTDGGGAPASAAISVTVNAVGSGTVQVRVAMGSDDAEESAAGSMSVSSSDLELVFDGSDQLVGLRFNAVAIPRGATINSASVQFQVDEATSTATALTIRGQAADNAATFSGSAKISTRSRTASAVSWTPVAWTAAGQAGAGQQTPGIASVIQEIVNRSGWKSGNSLAVIITGTGRRVAEAYEGLPSAAPLLRVQYSTALNTAPTATNVTISGTAQVGQVLAGNYTYSDADGDIEGTSTYRWLRDDAPISGATARSYTLVEADQGALIRFEVTPVAATGASPGAPVQSPAVGPVAAPTPNSAPTATNVTISGTAQVGQVLTGNYTYSDANGDVEGTSTYRWLRDGAAISGATARSYTLVAADQGAMVVFEVTPVAATGASPGAPVQSAAVGPVAAPTPNSVPTASNVTISGTAEVGRVLTGNYTYSDANGDAEGTSTYRWLRDGAEIGGAAARSYTLAAADQGAMIVFEVTPVAATGASPGAPVQSAAVGPVEAPNNAPVASNVTISGTPEVAQVLTGNYTYSDANGDIEGTSTYRWLRAGAPITGATARTYTLVAADQGAMIRFEVTPVAATGTSPGAPVQSPEVGPVAGTTGSGVVQVRVAARADDAEESATGTVSTGSSDLELVFDGSDQLVGMRFNAVAIPPGATITSASVQFQVDQASSGATSLTIHGQATDHAVAFSGTAKISTRTRTASAVSWAPAPWTVVGQAGANQQTPSIASLIQEIVNRPGWSSGNSLAIIITGTGARVAEAFDGLPTGAPLLRVEYSP
jgi:uncharacterized protein YjiK